MLEPSFAVDDARPTPAKGRRAPPVEEEGRKSRAMSIGKSKCGRGARMPACSRAWLQSSSLVPSAARWSGNGHGWSNIYRSFRSPPTEVARESPAPAAPKKTQERVEPGSAQQQAVTPPATPQLAAVAQKVVLYEEDPGDPNGKRFVGSAIWRTETVTSAPGQTPDLAIRADVEVPERKLAMTWVLRRNTDKGLPATHTVEIMFKLPADFPSGGITNVPGILMKQAEQTRGVPLAGSAVKVTNGFYLIGLSNVNADKERNVQLLKERAWFDIPVVYNNNRRAILAMEKGTPGERVFADAFKAWKQ